jgi:hypothetical protein
MATYTQAQLYGQGVTGETLSGTKTFTLTNASQSAGYFTLESVRNPINGYFTTPVAASMSITVPSPSTASYVSSPWNFSVALPSGTTTLTIGVTGSIAATSYYLRATGATTLVIS